MRRGDENSVREFECHQHRHISVSRGAKTRRVLMPSRVFYGCDRREVGEEGGAEEEWVSGCCHCCHPSDQIAVNDL